MRPPYIRSLIPAPRDDLCLAFANTLSGAAAPPTERLGGIDDLLGGSRHRETPAENIAAAGKRLHRHASEAATLFAAAIELREATIGFSAPVAVASRSPTRTSHLLNRAAGAAPGARTLGPAMAVTPGSSKTRGVGGEIAGAGALVGRRSGDAR